MSIERQEGRVSSQLLEAIERAGYDVASDASLSNGLAAYAVAATLFHSRQGGAGQRRKRGRNQPCPCGSGKKYKQCCLAQEKFDDTSVQRSPLEEPRLIPRLGDEDLLMEDIQRLARLFKTDQALSGIRFDAAKASRFLASELNAADAPDLSEELLDDVAQRYFVEVEDQKYPKGTIEALLDAAGRTSDPDELRSLALGLLFGTSAEDPGDEPHPLALLVFRLSVMEFLDVAQIMGPLVQEAEKEQAGLGPAERAEFDTTQVIADKLASLMPEEQELVGKMLHQMAESIEDLIMSGQFPVCLSLASVLPFYVEKILADHERRSFDIPAACDVAWPRLVEEDWQLFEELIRQWLKSDTGEDSELTTIVRSIAVSISSGWAELFAPHLFSAALMGVALSRKDSQDALPGEEELLSELESEGGFFEPTSFERYADFLESRGYPALAQRTRRLASRLPTAGATPCSEGVDGPSTGDGAWGNQ